MALPEYIIDASVGTMWIIKEEGSSKAVRFLEHVGLNKCRLIVPEFFYCEVGNACWKGVQMKRLSWKDAVVGLDRILDLNLQRRSDSEFADVALENALYYRISVYDALYISLAETYVAPLVTADKNLIRACRAKKFDFIESLEEIKLS